MKNLTGLAIFIAAQSYVNATDMDGNAYILHPIRIMMRLRTDDQELMQIAILYGVIEDDPENWTLGRLAAHGFSDRVLVALNLLTRRAEDSYDEYISRIADNPDARKVRLEHLRDNSDITRLKGVRDKDFERMKKYHKSFLFLKKLDEQNFMG